MIFIRNSHCPAKYLQLTPEIGKRLNTLTSPFFFSSLRRYKFDSYVNCQFKNHAFEKYAHISMISVSNSICEAKLLKPGNEGTEKKTKEKKSFSFAIVKTPYPYHGN